MEKLVILGSGCAGYSAAIYAARAGLKPLLVSGKETGGQLTWAPSVENYPGFSKGISGIDLTNEMKKQALKFGAKIKEETAKRFNILKNGFEIETDKETIQAKSVIIATGNLPRWLGVKGENKFKSKGVHVCASCDGYFYKNKEVAVIGGGDTACVDALYLSTIAKKVTIIHRRDEFRASKILQDKVKKNKKIRIIWNSVIEEIKGNKFVKSIIIKDNKNKKSEINVEGVFLAIGQMPNTEIFHGKIKLDSNGFIITNKTKTNIKGIFAAGDVQDPIFKQAITAAGSGCMAAMEANRYLQEKE